MEPLVRPHALRPAAPQRRGVRRACLAAFAGLLAVALGLPAAASARARDRDHDGLSDRQELKRTKTNPRRRDTDRDQLSDGSEVKRYRTNPRRPDTDRDGVRDGDEVKRYRTNPRRRDSDGDGVGDRQEISRGQDPLSPLLERPKPPFRPIFPILPKPRPTPEPPGDPPRDTTPPQTTIVSGPSGSTSSTSAGFVFSSSEPGSTFACRLDSGAWASCVSPRSYTALGDGTHTFEARARDAAGNVDPSPVSRSWTV